MDHDQHLADRHRLKRNPAGKRMNYMQQGVWEETRRDTERGPAIPDGLFQDGSMEARVAKLEADVNHLKTDMADTRAQVRNIANKVGGIANKVDVMEERTRHVATKAWVLSGVVVVLVTIIGACGWAAQQYLGPILARLSA
jgi:hypothetical protein